MSRLNLGAITAYAIAVKHGFEGTEEEWLASLKGEVDSELSETSENPLQNKVITKALNEKVDKVKEEVEVEVEEVKNKAEIALNNAVKAEQTAKEYTDTKFNGASKLKIYNTYSIMVSSMLFWQDMESAEKFLGAGQIILFIIGIPLWVANIEINYVPYTYTTAEEFEKELKEKRVIQIGHFSVRQFADLLEYAKTEYVDEKVTEAKDFAISEASTAQENARVYTDQKSAIHAKLNADNTFTQKNEFTGSLTIPNSPDNPETAKVTDTYTTRKTANADTTGLTVVDGSATLIEEIKGNTVRCENLLPYPYHETTKTENGLTFTVNSDGSIMINGQSTDYAAFCLTYNFKLKPSTTYTFSLGLPSTSRAANVMCDIWFYDNTDSLVRTFALKDALQYTFTAQENEYLRIWVKRAADNVATNTVVYPMLNEGETALPYQPYFTDLKNAQVSGIKSTGKNLINLKPLEIKAETPGTKIWEGNIKAPFTLSYKINVTEVKNDLSSALFAFKIDGTAKYISPSTYSWKVETGTLTEIKVVNWCKVTATVYDVMVNAGIEKLPYEPYVEDTMYLPKTLELGEWDSFNPQTGEITRKTKTLVLNGTENWYISGTNTASSTGEYRMAFDGSGIYGHTDPAIVGNIKCNNYNTYSANDGYLKKECIATYHNTIYFYDSNFNTDDISLWKAHLAELYAAGTPLIISYELATPTIEKIENVPNSYTVYDSGTETILGNENEEYGTKLTVTQTYSIHENPNEAAKKAYVQNGLAKKLDKTGGTITGHLIVENGTTTTVPSLAVKNNENTYGLVLEDDTYKLGKGTVDEEGNFKLDDGEGLPIALRDDSSLFGDEELLMWSSNGNKIVSTGITLSQLISKIERLE